MSKIVFYAFFCHKTGKQNKRWWETWFSDENLDCGVSGEHINHRVTVLCPFSPLSIISQLLRLHSPLEVDAAVIPGLLSSKLFDYQATIAGWRMTC